MEYQSEPTLADLIALLRRGLVFALAVAVGAGLLTYFLSKRTTPEYDSTTTLLASKPGNTQGTFGVSLVTAPAVDPNAYQAAAKSYPVLSEALTALGGVNPSAQMVADFAELVTVRVESAQQSSLLRVTVRDADPELAARAANALGSALLRWDEARAKQNLQAVIDTLESQVGAFDEEMAALAAQNADGSLTGQIDGLRSLRTDRSMQLNAVRALRASAVGLLEVLEPAMPALEPSRPQPLRNAALAFILGIFLVYGLILLRDAMDTRFRGAEDLVRTTELPVLGELPRLPSGVTRLPHEATGYLRTNVQFATAQDLPKVIVVTSPQPAEGKTTVALGLAESFARNDYHTLFIDADMRKPQASERLGLTRARMIVDGAVTLQDYLEDPTRGEKPMTVQVDRVTLDLIPTFEPASAPTELLSRSFASVLQRFGERYDAIIIDTPPTLPVADALAIAPHVTGIILAISQPTTDKRSVNTTLSLLERVGVRILGTAITNVEQTSAQGKRGYGYGYGYGYGNVPESTPHKAVKVISRAHLKESNT